MKNLFRALLTHALGHLEIYVFVPLAVLLTVGALAGVPLLTGRAVLDDPAVLVGSIYRFTQIVLAAAAAGLIQTHLIGYRSKVAGAAPLGDDVFDALITLLLLAGFAYLIIH